ncbi:MAG TPA: transglycosylase domain-containing protein [Candidatus Dormibacteraeota bacterium]|nr:transglycosylase domain-containing protein [Candidatus Dormibacteraeota bacterium]
MTHALGTVSEFERYRRTPIVWPPRPAAGHHIRRRKRRARWPYRLGAFAAVAVVVAAVTPPLYIAYASQLPDPTLVASPIPGDTLIYAGDRTTLLADLHPAGYQHYDEQLSSMGTYLPEAVVSIEDRNFYQEHGIDPGSIARAALVNLKAGHTVEGASTITQQLVKLRVLGDEPTFQRKLNEALLAMEVERKYPKSRILEMYLNDVTFGNSAVGSEAASRIYFHKATRQLDLAQAAMLAGLVRGPTLYDPFVNWDAAKARQLQVLTAMVVAGKVTQHDADEAYAEDLKPPDRMFMPANTNNVLAPGFVGYVTQQLVQTYGTGETYGGGLRVYTTLNLDLQKAGQDAISSTQRALAWRNVQQGALVALDPRSGAIVAMVASANPTANGGQYNLALWPPRNPGSSMKIFTYTAAINSGRYTMTTPVADAPFKYLDPGSGTEYQPQNYDGRYHGTCQVQQCIGNSLNIPAVKVELGVGVPQVVQMARAMGAPPWQQHSDGSFTSNDSPDSFGPSLTLGGYGETPLQMATGASVLATQGVLRQPFAIERIDRAGQTIFNHTESAKQVLDPRVAFIMSSILSTDDNRALIFGRNSDLVIPGFTVAVKTGTSDSFADAWTVGYTPKLAVAVWMGNPDWRVKMTEGSDSYYVAVPAWRSFLTQALPLLGGNDWYSMPPGITVAFGNYYLSGTQPSSPPESGGGGSTRGDGGGGGDGGTPHKKKKK